MLKVFDPFALYKTLYGFYGPSMWWPGETPFEVIIGAILTQNTAWRNVERAIANLKKANILDFNIMNSVPNSTIADLIRPAGYYNIKAIRIRNLLDAIDKTGGINAFFKLDTAPMRRLLLDVNGIGEETADSICCYAANRPVFVCDAYTKRMLIRHGFAGDRTTYSKIQKIFMKQLPEDLQILKDMHAYIVFVGKDFCRKTKPDCDDCPVLQILGRPV